MTTAEPMIEGKTLAQWKALLVEHRTRRPLNSQLEKLRQWVYEKEAIQFRVDQLENMRASALKPVEVAE